MPRILIAECKQEISSFNPQPSAYDNFVAHAGSGLLAFHRGIDSEIHGALGVFDGRDDIETVPGRSFRSSSAGPLAQEAFERLAGEWLEAVAQHADTVDAAYFCMHGAMGAAGEADPEGHLLYEARCLLDPDKPIVASFDLHGIITARMIEQLDGFALYHTYPHVDFEDTGQRAARLLLRILDEGLRPTVARVFIPALVRGDELVTEKGLFGSFIRRAQELEKNGQALAAGMIIGNPFTDAPELGSQALVIEAGDGAGAATEAEKLAADFWAERARMQADLVPLEEAVARAKGMQGPLVFTDAADATSSGASGDSNAILAELVRQGYEGTVLAPLVDAPAVRHAFEVGVGGSALFRLGGSVDPRFTPLELEASVEMLARGPYYFESWGNYNDAGERAVLRAGNITVVAVSRSVAFIDRSPFLAHGLDPRRFDLTVVKSPHCQYRFFDEWATANLNVDAPGSTSANLPYLGHTVCPRPMYPLEPQTEFAPQAVLFRRGE